MRIELADTFSQRFERQLRYIAKDSSPRAGQFKQDVIAKIKSLTDNPMRCRKSIFFDDENIRDLIFKGYAITYRIKCDKIEVFGFTKYQENPTD